MVVRMPGPHRVDGITAGVVIRCSRHRSDLFPSSEIRFTQSMARDLDCCVFERVAVVGGGLRRGFSSHHERPKDAGVLGGQSDGGDVLAAALAQLLDPAALRIVVLWGVAHCRARAMYQQCSQVDIAALTDAKQPGLAAGGILLGYLIFGISKQGRHLVVSYTERGEWIRLISARQLTSRERRAYEA
jgi:hypothetical protein